MSDPNMVRRQALEAQREAITVRGVDILVTAGAGTGKTYTLVERYLSLLDEGLSPRSLVAITFTNKAAREMRNRVRHEVGKRRSGGTTAATPNIDWTLLYTQLDTARIGTIHGLCSEILRTHPVEAGLDPRFQVFAEGQAQLVRQQCVDEAVSWAAYDPVAAHCFKVLGEQGVKSAAGWALDHRLAATPILDNLPADLMKHWAGCVWETQRPALGFMSQDESWTTAIAELRAHVPLNADDPLAKQRNTVTEALEHAIGPPDGAVDLMCLARLNFARGLASAWPGGTVEKEAVKQALKGLQALWKDRVELGIALNELDSEWAATMPGLQALFRFVNGRYRAVKQSQDVLDYDDLEAGALRLLQDCPYVRAYWQDQIAALLVDEFQDTNSRQRDLVAALNGDGKRLFMVGDAKQSIYRFRGADVTVFRAEEQQVAQAGGKVLTLNASYRAHPGLVDALNALLRPILGADDPTRPYLAPFSDLQSIREEPGPGFEPPFVEFLLTIGSKSDGALDRAADALASRLVECVEGGGLSVLVEGGGARPLEYGDIAILCRASSSFPAYEEAMERAGVPFLTVAGGGFYERPEIRDVLNALQALTDPGDDLVLAELLRSPVCGFSDVELYRLSRYRDRNQAQRSLWEVLQRRPQNGNQTKGERAVRMIRELHPLVGRTSVGDLLKAFLDYTDYPAALLMAGMARAARNVAKLLTDAQSSGIVGTGEFLAYVAGLKTVAAREGEARSTAEGAVQIMSVHQAKGLEFPVVAIGDVGRGESDSRGPFLDGRLGLVWPIGEDTEHRPGAYQLARLLEAQQELAESSRLLYVASTRAREKLFLSGCLPKDGKGRSGWLARLMDAHGWSAGVPDSYYPEGGGSVTRDWSMGTTPVRCVFYEPNWVGDRRAQAEGSADIRQQVPSDARLEPVPTSSSGLVEGKLEQEADPPPRVWRVVPSSKRPHAPAWVVGKLVHRALTQWSLQGEQLRDWLEAGARDCGLTDGPQIRDAVRRSSLLLTRFRQSELYVEMDSAERRMHEVPYQHLASDVLEVGIIDVLFLSRGSWTLVEFKTDEVRSEGELAAFLDRQGYRQQAERYLRATEQWLGFRPRGLLCMLDVAGRVRTLDLLGNRT
jgi:ATP-dependent helicase/nuclease subunit A